MASTFQPPINLNPDQDSSQQTAFINQNFQSLASALETNSFRVVKQGSISIDGGTAHSTTGNFAFVQSASIPQPHGLDFVPVVIGYLGGAILPSSTFSSPATNQAAWLSYFLEADSVNVTFTGQGMAFNGATVVIFNLTATYFVLQLTQST